MRRLVYLKDAIIIFPVICFAFVFFGVGSIYEMIRERVLGK